MNIELNKTKDFDMPFLGTMLYEAVFWCESPDKPTIKIALSLADISKSLNDYGNRDRDIGVVGSINSIQVGAAWFEYWKEKYNVRGYINEEILGVRSKSF